MNIRLYSFSKRNKSSLRASTSGGTSYEVGIFNQCSIEHPVMIFDFEPFQYNYAYIPKWDRFYFINDWYFLDGQWIVNLTEDYLASFYDELRFTGAMVLYATGSDAIDSIIDKRIPVTSGVEITTKSASLSGMNWLTSGQGTPVLSITGKGSNGIYALSASDLPELIDGIDLWYDANISDYFDAIKQLAYGGSAMDNIKGAFALPFTINTGGVSERLTLGGYPCINGNNQYINGYRLIQYNQDASCNIQIPWKYSDWRRSSPYSSVKIFLPLAGLFTLSNEDIKNDNSLDVSYTFNRGSGDYSLTVKGHSSGNNVITYSSNCAMGLFLGSSGTDLGKIITGNAAAGLAVGGGIAALALGATGAAAVGAIGAIGGGLAASASATLEGLGGASSGIGGLSGGAAVNMGTDVKVFVESKGLSDTLVNIDTVMGTPAYRYQIIGNYSGYVQTDGMQFASSRATASEKNQINSLCDSGIYLE